MQHILVYSDSLFWGIVPTTRRRLPFDARWPGVMEFSLSSPPRPVRVVNAIRLAPIETPGRPLAQKFIGAAAKSVGLAAAYEETAKNLRCYFFDSAKVTTASTVDGIHLDADQHRRFGKALAAFIATLSVLR